MSARFLKAEHVRKVIRQAEDEIKKMTGMDDMRLALYSGSKEDKSPVEMLHVIAEALGMEYSDYFIQTSKPRIVELKRVSICLLWELYHAITYERIAEVVGNYMDHSTVMHHVQKAQDYIKIGDEMFCTMYKTAHKAASEWLKER